MKEVTYEDWQKNPTPRMMWVWDGYKNRKVKRKVLYIFNEGAYPVLALDYDGTIPDNYRHCAEIEEPKTRRMTCQELAWWLQDGEHREYRYGCESDDTLINSLYVYRDSQRDYEVPNGILIRENGGEWHEPLVEVVE